FDEIKKYKVNEIIVTEISKDGTLEGVDDKFYRKVCALTDLSLIASGGVNSLDDVETLSQTGVRGVIIGKAVYEGKIDLKEAFKKYGGD
ncbi:MAG: 1-(5-phosphoribosyl)-5-((5-phosphoribosylamino)methylideneamino)imidazole-4-carboxamide isomerase, partial [Elusimicrobia bacterium]|nr:1-(5-phosphoribosyl)-5-((5-phosphoribosylamino)methylideneamino)imidazole-4-carboxamide isomerase [Elusimicrobiota bacterium]